jgi:hypothetical protein
VAEAKAWADKTAALAYYASLMNDRPLSNFALRAEARAERRMGELLKQIPEQRGGDRGNAATGGRPPVAETRTRAAEDAGLSEHQRKTALRIANIPRDEFEAAVESVAPPTITALAERGTTSRSIDLGQAERVRLAMAHSSLAAFATFCSTCDPVFVATIPGIDTDGMGAYATKAEAWLHRFLEALRDEQRAA